MLARMQGEHNVGNLTPTATYACLFGGMINAWRDAWRGIGDFPFIYVQLAPYITPGNVSVIRLAQRACLPKIGLDTTGESRLKICSIYSRLADPFG